MLRHHAFFEALGVLEEKDPAWRSTLAALSVLRQVDMAFDPETATTGREWTGIRAARDAVGALSEGDITRAILTGILNLVEQGSGLSAELGKELLSLGRALDLEGRWAFAVDVFQTIVRDFPRPASTALVIEACTALGAAARSVGDWETSARAYAEAQHLADTTGDRAGSLTVQVGIADTHLSRGNLPEAERELQTVLKEARDLGLQEVEAIALHCRASVAHSRGNYQEAIHLAYRSLELTTNRAARDRVLADIAAAYAGLGMRDTARDGYSIVAVSSPHQWVRWQATLNLMELAIDEGDEASFDRYLKQTESASLDRRLRGYFLFFRALGDRRFGRPGAEEELEVALEFASANQLHQIEFDIEQAMSPAKSLGTPKPASRSTESSEDGDDELKHIAEVLEQLREEATTASARL